MIRRQNVSRGGIAKCGDRTECICHAKCGDTHGGACSDQNCLHPLGFMVTCDEHYDENDEKYRERIEKNIAALPEE